MTWSRLISPGMSLLIALGACPTLRAQTDGGEARPPASIRVPAGFVVEQVAGPPLVEHPMMACFDDRGRLFVAEAAGLNLKADDLLKDPPNRIRMLEDRDGDGRFDTSTIFADKMTMPMGVLWHRGALYTASPPSVWRLEDRDGDGRADERKELVTRFGFTGNAADIHGPFLGPDGRIYWADGRHGHDITRPDGRVLTGKAARIFRCRPDGSDVEVVCGGGMDNPVEVAFTDEGEPFATVDILISRPSRIDAIIYAVEGGAYPHYEPVLHEFKRTGDLLPAVSQLGWVAPAGLMRYRDGGFGPDFRDNLFSAQFNMRRIQRHPVERAGASFLVRNEDFLVADDPDFHPTDVLQDPDGSLLVVNTGGWFRIGCPTSQVAKPEIKGAIYRVRRTGAARPADPHGLKVAWDSLRPGELGRLLDDPRHAVRDRAIDELARQVPQGLPTLRETLQAPSVQARRNAVWALARAERVEAGPLLSKALRDPDLSVRLAAAHTVGLNRIDAAFQPLLAMVAGDEPAARRTAATALGRLGRAGAVPTLLAALRTENDRFLDHALIYALIEIADRGATLAGLSDPSPSVRRGALIALDQMEGGDLTRAQVVPLVATTDRPLQKSAFSIIAKHEDWGGAVVGLLRQWVVSPELDESGREGLHEAVRAFAANREIQELVAQSLRSKETPLSTRLLLTEAVSRTSLKELPAAWTDALDRSLEDQDDHVVRQAIASARAVGGDRFDGPLKELASDRSRPRETRVAAWVAVAPRAAAIDQDDFAFLRGLLHRDQVPLLRLGAAEALGTCRLDDRQLMALTPSLAEAGSLELPRLLGAYEHSKDPEVAETLLAALAKAPGFESLSAETLRSVLAAYPDGVRNGGAATGLVQRLEVDRRGQEARLVELEPVLGSGDSKRGRTVFFGRTAACSTCHAVNADGGRIGPDLTKIGSIRTGRDLLEAITFPSVSFVRGYEPYLIATHDGRLFSGTLARETLEAIFLNTTDAVEVRIPRDQIQDLQQSRQSIMPQGLDAQLTRGELADLLAFLKQLR